MRRLFVAGNWKMNTTRETALKLAGALVAEAGEAASLVDIAVCPPTPYLMLVHEAIRDSGITLGAQNAYFAAPGAYTGEVAVEMLLDVGCQWVILGHSERRHILGETDELINKKIDAGTSQGLSAIFCVGEKLSERESAKTETVLETQLQGGLAGIDATAVEQVVIAYEPVWAIGTGVTAAPEQAEAAHKFIRGWLAENYSRDVAARTRILYGGSVKADNARTLMDQENVDGALVGGASLSAEQFLPIVRAALELSNATKK